MFIRAIVIYRTQVTDEGTQVTDEGTQVTDENSIFGTQVTDRKKMINIDVNTN